jgi:uncharacterized membrane protein
MTRKTFWILFSIAVLYRIAYIGRAPLWYDENFTLILARLPFDRMIMATAGDVHPPLWYLIEWALFHALPSLPVWAIRIPALIFSLLAFVMFVQLCDLLRIPAGVRITASFLMAILPMQLWYAQEGRMYALLEFLVLSALVTGLRRMWLLFLLTATAMMYTQNYAMFYLAVIGFVLIVLDRTVLHRVLEAGLLTGLLYSPWAFVIARQMTEISGRYWIMDASAGAVIGALYKQFWTSAMLAPGIVPSYVITFALLFIGLWTVLSEKHASWFVLIAMALGPVALAWIASVLWQPLLLFRPLIAISPFLYLIAAWPMLTMSRRAYLYASCFVAPILMLGIGGYYANIADMKGEGAISPMLNSLDYVRAHWQAGDVIYYTDDGPMVNLMPYTDLPQYKMPACDERIGYAPVLGSLSDSTRAALGIPIADLADVPHVRAWVFAPRSPLHPLCYEDQIAAIAPQGQQVLTVDDNEFIQSGVWLVEK